MDVVKLRRLIIMPVISMLILGLNPLASHAEWKKDSNGWWYTEGSSYATGWKNISGKWYFFEKNGYMAHEKVVDGYYLGANGEMSELSDYTFDEVSGKIIKYNRKDSIEVSIPSEIKGVKVKAIGDKAFYGCTQINSIEIPEGVTTIESNAFASCYSLKKINIPSSMISIGANAFNGCTSLVNIDIKNNSINISNGAFSGCYNLMFNVSSEQVKQMLIDSGVAKESIIKK